MKKFILLFLLIPSLCFAVEPIDFSKSIAMSPAILGLAGGKVAASGVAGHCDGPTTDGAGNTILLCEDFDGSTECASTYSSTCQAAWTVSVRDGGDLIEFNDADAPAPLQGTYSSRIYTEDSSATTTNMKRAFTANGTFYAFVLVHISALGDGTNYFFGFLSGASDACVIGRVVTTNKATLWNGTSATLSAAENVFVEDTTYCVWLDYTKNTETTGCKLYVAAYDAGCTKPSLTAQATTPNLDADTVILMNKESSIVYNDWLRVRTSATYGDNPD